jgi:endogenous inhibitor of DNA gyrase (YacG/DUF329 family)
VIGTISERDLARQVLRFQKLCRVLSHGYGIDHPQFDVVDKIPKEGVRKILDKVRTTLTDLARGETVMDTATIRGVKQASRTDVHIASARSRPSLQAHSIMQIDQSTRLPDALVTAVLMVIHFHKVVVTECPVCQKLYVKGTKRQSFCSSPCKQQSYRNRLPPQKAMEQRMQKSQRYHEKKYKGGD